MAFKRKRRRRRRKRLMLVGWSSFKTIFMMKHGLNSWFMLQQRWLCGNFFVFFLMILSFNFFTHGISSHLFSWRLE
jgi:hypothetical protein